MTGKPHSVSIEQMMVGHYLFDLGQSVEKTAEILGMDEEYVRRIYREDSKFHTLFEKDHQ